MNSVGEVELFGLKTEAKYSPLSFTQRSSVYNHVYYLEPEEYRLAALTPVEDGELSRIVDASLLSDPSYWPIVIIKFSIHYYGPISYSKAGRPRDHRIVTHTAMYIERYGGFRFAIINGITDSGWLYRLGIVAINSLRPIAEQSNAMGATHRRLGISFLPLSEEDWRDAKREFDVHYSLAANNGRKSTTIEDLPSLGGL